MRPIVRFNRLQPVFSLFLLCIPGLFVPWLSHAAIGSASSEAVLLDATPPDLELAPLPGHLLLQGGDQYQFSWTTADANPGQLNSDYTAALLVDGAPHETISWYPGGNGHQWDWTAPEIQSATCQVAVTVRDIMGNTTTRQSIPFTVLYSTSDTPEAGTRTALGSPYPNPFNPSCRIAFSLEQSGPALLAVHDLRGRRVRTLQKGSLAQGDHVLTWDGKDEQGQRQPAGAYLFVLDVAGKGGQQRLVARAVLLP
jgi:hypothetical protein